MKRAKIIHDNLNAVGGSERLAFSTLELLNELKFKVDLATLQEPNMEIAKKSFGEDNSHLWELDKIEILNPYFVLGINEMRNMNKVYDIQNSNISYKVNNTENNNKLLQNDYIYFNENNYDLIINTHGDLFPYYVDSKTYNINNTFQSLIKEQDKKDINISQDPIKITYCHYPLLPIMIKEKNYSFLQKLIPCFDEFPDHNKDTIALKVLEKYNLMMKNTMILTNSKFSKQAIEQIYSTEKLFPLIIYPPVDIKRFAVENIYKYSMKRSTVHKKTIISICRIHPSKNIEIAIEIGKLLSYAKRINEWEIIIVGNMLSDDAEYLSELNRMIIKYGLQTNIRIKPNVPVEELQHLIHKSSIYVHPTRDEPFGISIVETMSAGVLPIVPNSGGVTDFVPQKYQYNTLEEAANTISYILNSDEKNLEKERISMIEIANNFSNIRYKEHLKELIENSLGRKINIFIKT